MGYYEHLSSSVIPPFFPTNRQTIVDQIELCISLSLSHTKISQFFPILEHPNLQNLEKTPKSMPIPIQNQETKPKKLISLFIKCVIMALFLSLFLIFLLFLGFAALVLLHFLITSTAFHRRHRRRNQHHNRFPTNPTSSFDLPCVSYCGSQQSVRDCAICLEGFKEGEFCRKLPDCGHLFHVKCVDSWLTRVLNCPICRTRVRVDSGNSGSVISDEDWKRWWAVGVSG